MNELRQRAIELYDHFTHEGRDRRAFMAVLTKLAGGAAAANALLAGIAANPAAAAIVAEDDPRITAKMVKVQVAPGRVLDAYMAMPKGGHTHPAVMVVHENRGLQPYTRDVARRLATAGFIGLAPDFLTLAGGTPVGDDDKARGMIAALDLAQTVKDAIGALVWLKAMRGASGNAGVVGFCWGGALADRIAVEGGHVPAAVCAFYGPAPDPAEAAKVQAPLLLHYAGLDTRVDATAKPWVAALQADKKAVTVYQYPGVNHAFHNDTSPERYNEAAATLAWDRTIAFFKKILG